MNSALDRQRTVKQDCLERAAFIRRHDDEYATVIGGIDLMDRADVRVFDRGSCLRLSDESPRGVLGFGQVGRQKFERNRAVEPRVVGAIDYTHPASTYLFLQAIMGYRMAFIHRSNRSLSGIGARA